MVKKASSNRSSSSPRKLGFEHYLVPSLIGGVIAWYFSESLTLGIMVLIAVMIGNYIGFKILQSR